MTRVNNKRKITLMLSFLAVAILAIGTAVFGMTGAVSAKADDLDLTMKLSLDTVDEFDTHGYKIEVASRENESEAYPFDDATNPYDYVITVVDKTSSYWNPRDGKLFFEENSHEAVWNIKTPSGKKVTGGGDYKWSKIYATTTTDSSIASFTGNNNEKIIYPDTGDRAENGSDWKCGETVMTFSFKEGSGANTCETHGERVPCTCWIDGDGQGEVLTGMTLRVLYRVVHIEDNEYLFTGATKDPQNDNAVWLNFGANDVLGVSGATNEWSYAEVFLSNTNAFFKNIYYFENFDLANATTESLQAALAGRDLYTLMTGENFTNTKLAFQTNVRTDHVELYKVTKNALTDTSADALTPVNFNEGDAFYLAEGLQMIGHDGNGNWAIASEGGAANILERGQFFYFDGANWTIDQFDIGVKLDKSSATIEDNASVTLVASADIGKFANGELGAVSWNTSNSQAATVEDGVVTGVAPGEAVITATANGKSAVCVVTVVDSTLISGITLDKDSAELNVGEDETFVATVTGNSQVSQIVTWTSSNENVATVENGVVTAIGEGTATITATAADGTHTATATVTVTAAPSGGDDDKDPETPPTGDGDDDKDPETPPTGDDDDKDPETPPTGDGDDDKDPETPPTGDGDKEEQPADEGCGCGGSVLGASAIAGIALLAAGAFVLVSKKRRA